MSEAPSYSNRRVEQQTVVKIEPRADGGAWVTGSSGWTAGAPASVAARLGVGSTYGLETRGFSMVTGWRINGVWVDRKSDADLDREHAETMARIERDRRERLEANRQGWTVRSAELPGWLRERLDVFRDRGGEHFETDGWGYELVVCELAAMYYADDFQDTDRINAYAEREGTSGNQHDCAKALARAHHQGLSLAGTASALTPLTGDPLFEATS
jgi:hypothetical protein